MSSAFRTMSRLVPGEVKHTSPSVKKTKNKRYKNYLEIEFYFKMHVLIYMYTFSFAFEFNEHKKHANHSLQINTNLEVLP